MKIPELLNQIKEIGSSGNAIRIGFPVRLGKADVIAADLLLNLFDEMENATLGEVHEVLDSAKWLATLLHSAVPIDKEAQT